MVSRSALTLSDPEQANTLESIETTPEHPFSVQQPIDTSPRPQPEGHEDLGQHWVGAGHLKVGDQVKQADGTVGIVAGVVNLAQPQQMYNLTVSEAHTYYVGQEEWLVHNCGEEQKALLSVLQSQALKKAGFSDKGIPILIDENMQSTKLYNDLLAQGYNVRTVNQVLGNGTLDEDTLRFAQSTGVRVLTRDSGRQLDGGFGSLAIQLDGRVQASSEVIRVLNMC